MKAWLSQPIARGEAIAWAILVPAVLVIVSSGWSVVGSLSIVRRLLRPPASPAPPTLELFVRVGELPWAIAFGLCAVISVLAVATRQRLWVKFVAPVVFAVIASAVSQTYSRSYSEWAVASRDAVDAKFGADR